MCLNENVGMKKFFWITYYVMEKNSYNITPRKPTV